MTKPLKTVAILDSGGALVGTELLAEPGPDRVAFDEGIDLPLDGTYKWDADHGTFVPLGHGFPRLSTRPPVTDGYALFSLIRSLGESAPRSSRDWADWYDLNLRKRDEEGIVAQRRKNRRK